MNYVEDVNEIAGVAAGNILDDAMPEHADPWIEGTHEEARRRWLGGRSNWPDMQLTGTIVGNNAEDGSVILDGAVVGVGQIRDGVRVVRVESDAAELECNGERRWVLSGQRINQ